MFGTELAEYLQWEPAALHADLERLELEARALDARRLAVSAAAEARQVPAIDGHKSTKAYVRATCNQPSHVALTEVRRARIKPAVCSTRSGQWSQADHWADRVSSGQSVAICGSADAV